MRKSTVKINRDYIIGEVDDRIYSSFVEHMGNCVYNGLYQPGHPLSDERGFRTDVLKLVKRLKLAAIRYPGGNFTSGYNWEDTVGDRRPVKLDYAWRQTEPNTFGLHEFMAWLGETGSGAVMTVNLGTRGPDDARNLLEYVNHPGGSYYSDKRRANGRENPYGINTWCLGNELDANWQICHKKPKEYGRLAVETARLMRRYDPGLELIAVGSSHNRMPSFPEWDRKVLMECYDDVDYIALHKYVSHEGMDTPDYLAAPIEMEQQIKDIISVCDYVKSVKRSKRTMKLAFDEWNVTGFNKDRSRPDSSWQVGPGRDVIAYTMEDALAFSGMLLTLIRHADRVKMACQAILINTLPMILTSNDSGSCATATYYPFLHTSLYGRGMAMQCLTQSPVYSSVLYGDVPVMDTAAVFDEANEAVTLFAVNRSETEQEMDIKLAGFDSFNKAVHLTLCGNLKDANRPESPNECIPAEKTYEVERNEITVNIPPYSWNVFRFIPNPAGGSFD